MWLHLIPVASLKRGFIPQECLYPFNKFSSPVYWLKCWRATQGNWCRLLLFIVSFLLWRSYYWGAGTVDSSVSGTFCVRLLRRGTVWASVVVDAVVLRYLVADGGEGDGSFTSIFKRRARETFDLIDEALPVSPSSFRLKSSEYLETLLTVILQVGVFGLRSGEFECRIYRPLNRIWPYLISWPSTPSFLVPGLSRFSRRCSRLLWPLLILVSALHRVTVDVFLIACKQGSYLLASTVQSLRFAVSSALFFDADQEWFALGIVDLSIACVVDGICFIGFDRRVLSFLSVPLRRWDQLRSFHSILV